MGLNGAFLYFDKHAVILNEQFLQSILLDILAIIKAILPIDQRMNATFHED